jgi:hypothetical protein
MRDLAQTAPAGQVLRLCETQAVERGRDLLRAALQEACRRASMRRRKSRGGAAMCVRGPAASQATPRPRSADGHRDRLGYAVRLRRGQVIGSGLVEGTIKQRVNLRLKRTGARWQATRVGPFVELLALSDGPEWTEHWTAQAA